MGPWWLVAASTLALLLAAIVATTFLISRQARLDRAEIRRDIIDAQGKLGRVGAHDRAYALTGDARSVREREQSHAADRPASA